jgi:O-methyltransferase
MNLQLWTIRKGKALFFRFRLHALTGLLAGPMALVAQITKCSRWIHSSAKPDFDDFYSGRFRYDKRYDLYRHVVDSEKLDRIDYLEFGVSQGHSFRWWASNIRNPDSRFFGFDTFSGLPENWGGFSKGAMSVEGAMPAPPDGRCRFIKGLFQDTLPTFLDGYDGRSRRVIHMDADLYSSTLFVLTSLAPRLKEGDILMFDEFTVPAHEFRAFTDFTESYYLKTDIIGAVNNYFQIAMKIRENPLSKRGA